MNQYRKVSDECVVPQKAKSSIGSVTFFKYLIVLILSLLILSLISINILFQVQNRQLVQEILQLQLEMESVQLGLNSAHNATDAISPAPSATPSATPSAAPSAASVPTKESFPYQVMFPDLYAQRQYPVATPPKTLFLTFDDGPSENTVKVLAILKKHSIKATFFVVGKDNARSIELMKQIVEEGHSIGVHTYTHVYEIIYSSIEAYLEDFKLEYDLIYKATGIKPSIFRFPGGSINSYNRNIYQQLIAEMTRRGFTYYDWNISSGDGSSNTTAASIKNNILSKASQLGQGIVLMHDAASKGSTAGVLEEVIVELISRGFKFAPIDNKVIPITFLYLQ